MNAFSHTLAPTGRALCKMRRMPPDDAADADSHATVTSSRNSGKNHLLCRGCRFAVTKESWAIQINQAHRHTFANPHGIVFEIRCFSQAPGCAPVSRPSLEFSWFSGFSWQIVVCRRCQMHLGWRFYQAEGFHFFGLITDHLISSSDIHDSTGQTH